MDEEEEYIIEIPVCRVCLQSSIECVNMEAYVVNDRGNENLRTYLEYFQYCTNINITKEDTYPKHICNVCCAELLTAEEFISKAKMSQDILEKQSEEIKTEHETSKDETKFIEYFEDDEIIFFSEETEEVDEKAEFLNEDLESRHSSDREIQDTEEIVPDESENIDLKPEVVSDSEFSIYEFKESRDNSPKEHFKCNLCHLRFQTLEDLNEHGQENHENAKFRCEVCYSRYTTQNSLSDHIKRQHDETYVKCNICNTSLKKMHLRAHKNHVHNVSEYLCSACPRTFKTKTGLQIHIETHNENRQRDFECEECHKMFLTERTYKAHKRTHWHREPFKCNLCEKQFLQKVNLKLHMQMHRGETVDCVYCDKKFVRKTDLKIHMRFHTGNFPYECQYCDKRFAIVSHLNYHQKRHQGFVYKCKVCDKEFINMSGLRNHSFQHTMMPFSCSLCAKGFPTKFKIRRHVKTVHHIEDGEELESCIFIEKKDQGNAESNIVLEIKQKIAAVSEE